MSALPLNLGGGLPSSTANARSCQQINVVSAVEDMLNYIEVFCNNVTKSPRDNGKISFL